MIRALKEPAGGQRQENLEKGGNHHIDETISIIPHMGHRTVAKDLSGTLMRTWNLPALWVTVPMTPILSTAQRRQLCGRTPGITGQRGGFFNNQLITTIHESKGQHILKPISVLNPGGNEVNQLSGKQFDIVYSRNFQSSAHMNQ